MEQRAGRRWFFFLAAASLGFGAGLAWAVVLREWLLVVIGVTALPSMIQMLADAFNQAWPGSRFGGWYGRFPRFRPPKAQGIAVGFAFLVSVTAMLIILDDGMNAVALGFMALICTFWLVRLARAIHTEGWRGDKRTEK
jgi:hypothetical protein